MMRLTSSPPTIRTSLPSAVGLLFFVASERLKRPWTEVVLHLVREVVRVRGDVDDADDVDLLAEETLVTEGLEDQAADPAKPLIATLVAILAISSKYSNG
ncbi:MAG: hypothetical protein U0599_27145 [Vicinamibacteria bacterium]